MENFELTESVLNATMAFPAKMMIASSSIGKKSLWINVGIDKNDPVAYFTIKVDNRTKRVANTLSMALEFYNKI